MHERQIQRPRNAASSELVKITQTSVPLKTVYTFNSSADVMESANVMDMECLMFSLQSHLMAKPSDPKSFCSWLVCCVECHLTLASWLCGKSSIVVVRESASVF